MSLDRAHQLRRVLQPARFLLGLVVGEVEGLDDRRRVVGHVAPVGPQPERGCRPDAAVRSMTEIERPSGVSPAERELRDDLARDQRESRRRAPASARAERRATAPPREEKSRGGEGGRRGEAASGARSARVRNEARGARCKGRAIAPPPAEDQERDRAHGGPRSRDHQEDRVVEAAAERRRPSRASPRRESPPCTADTRRASAGRRSAGEQENRGHAGDRAHRFDASGSAPRG